MGDSVGDPVPSSAPQGNGGTSLSVITEGVGELAVIDPEVAKKACEEVLEKVKLMHGVSSDSLTKAADGSEAERAPRTAVDLPNGDVGEGCEIRCLDDLPGTASRIQEEDETTANTVKTARKRQKNNSAKQSWLLRLFESKLFDISMAISYLYNSKEPGVQAYIGNRLFCFRNEEVDFYLPQLLNMYIHMDEDVGDAIKPYIVHRCRQSINFSLQCALLLGAYSSDMHISTQRHSRGTKLRKLILSDELKPAHKKRELPSLSPAPDMGLSPSKRTHQRSKSDATVTISLSSNLKRTASNPKVESEEEVTNLEACRHSAHGSSVCRACGERRRAAGSAFQPAPRGNGPRATLLSATSNFSKRPPNAAGRKSQGRAELLPFCRNGCSVMVCAPCGQG